VVIWETEAAIKVPVGSLFRQGEGWAAFVVTDGVATLQPVKLGQRNDTEGEILEGLAERQTVVLHPPDTLKDGLRVAARGQ
jgi:HlyD family secretion protein